MQKHDLKIGILTYHSSYNFGANLQALAIQSALLKKGVKVVIVNYVDPQKLELYRKMTPPLQAEEHEQFARRYFHLSPMMTSAEEVEEYCIEALDAIVVGSDAVFRLMPRYSPIRWLKLLTGRTQPSLSGDDSPQLPPYWLDWQRHTSPRGIIKASLSGSATGTSFYFLRGSLYRKLWNCIRDFDYLSVRDGWTRLMLGCLTLGTRLPDLCPDPVFCLKDNFVVPEEERSKIDVSRTILLSGHFKQPWIERLIEIAHAGSYMLANLPNPDQTFEFVGADQIITLPLSPLSWYNLLATAAGFIGIRYHALVSCVANGTPVIAVDDSGKLDFVYKLGSRAFDLCRRAEITKRYYSREKLDATKPEYIFESLFDRRTLNNSDNYAEFAKGKISGILDHILRLAHY